MFRPRDSTHVAVDKSQVGPALAWLFRAGVQIVPAQPRATDHQHSRLNGDRTNIS